MAARAAAALQRRARRPTVVAPIGDDSGRRRLTSASTSSAPRSTGPARCGCPASRWRLAASRGWRSTRRPALGRRDGRDQPAPAGVDGDRDAAGQPVVAPMAFTFLHAGARPDAAGRARRRSTWSRWSCCPMARSLVDQRGPHRSWRPGPSAMVVRIARDGGVTGVVRPRAHFTIDAADGSRGVRHNLGLESLTRTPDGRLHQRPRTAAGAGRPDVERSVAAAWCAGWSSSCRTAIPGRPAASGPMPLDPTPRRGRLPRAVSGRRERAVSELLRARRTRGCIALERACLRGRPAGQRFNPVRLIVVDVDGADDVSSLVSLAGVTTLACRQQAAAARPDDADRPRCRGAAATMSNFEGLAAGPPAPDGDRPMLIVISDDNFRDSQTIAVPVAETATR